mmetsp:Transcript_10391/g.27004  ORF Transcript_10391/g.27004 Transcript_10391/m.27004 type:complete len:566 (+) Transcript_10391:23-1720(+)
MGGCSSSPEKPLAEGPAVDDEPGLQLREPGTPATVTFKLTPRLATEVVDVSVVVPTSQKEVFHSSVGRPKTFVVQTESGALWIFRASSEGGQADELHIANVVAVYEVTSASTQEVDVAALVRTQQKHVHARLLEDVANPTLATALATAKELPPVDWCAVLRSLAGDPARRKWIRRFAPIRGVNIGGWLLMERWLTDRDQVTPHGPIPSPFEGVQWWEAGNEFDLSRHLRYWKQLDRLDRWRAEYITEADFVRMKELGINSVRLPFGYWIVSQEPYPPGPRNEYHHGLGLKYMDDAVEWAEKHGITVLLDLHGAPGGNSGAQTAGWNKPEWQPDWFDVDAAVEIISIVAKRYAGRPSVIGIELLNEPEFHGKVEPLVRYYQRAYRAVRDAGMKAEDVAVVICLFRMNHILTEGWWYYNFHLPGSEFPNLLYDLHLYYAFLPDVLDNTLTLKQVTNEMVHVQAFLMRLTGKPAFVGEWSLQLPFDGPLCEERKRLSPDELRELMTTFAQRQARLYGRSSKVGGYYWTWNAPKHERWWSYMGMREDKILLPTSWSVEPSKFYPWRNGK